MKIPNCNTTDQNKSECKIMFLRPVIKKIRNIHIHRQCERLAHEEYGKKQYTLSMNISSVQQQFGTRFGLQFSPTRPLWAELVIESPCPCVCLSVCVSAPSCAVFSEASHWPWDHMISSRPIIGPPSLPPLETWKLGNSETQKLGNSETRKLGKESFFFF